MKHNEWKVKPDGFGTPKPLLLLNRPANVDLRNHARRTKSVYLCHWDQGHEPCGVIAQRLVEAKQSRKKEQAGAYMGNEQDTRRKRVKQAARNAEVIDLTGDDTVGESKFRNYVGIENVENYPPGTMAQPWNI
ncbi:hypothetical protein G6011_00508 [Alternaria panax]|uniref:Uncharacterized protein n=1 Tax=Alternaria panax TaxID=48097 RepID=A0AAD4IIC5_9PLEO|nr:hypothetical protein G6011_00508 [Alternaria panax]